MGIYVEEIGGWVDKYIVKPVLKICLFVVVTAMVIGIFTIPIAAIKYLLKG